MKKNKAYKFRLMPNKTQANLIDKWFPSSKMCNACGCINKELTLSDREWICDCGTTHNRDHNAAINICNFGIRTVGMTGIAQ